MMEQHKGGHFRRFTAGHTTNSEHVWPPRSSVFRRYPRRLPYCLHTERALRVTQTGFHPHAARPRGQCPRAPPASRCRLPPAPAPDDRKPGKQRTQTNYQLSFTGEEPFDEYPVGPMNTKALRTEDVERLAREMMAAQSRRPSPRSRGGDGDA